MTTFQRKTVLRLVGNLLAFIGICAVGAGVLMYVVYPAVNKHLSYEETLAAPAVNALAQRQAADEVRTLQPPSSPQESQNLPPGEAQQVIRGATITNYQATAAQTDADPCT